MPATLKGLFLPTTNRDELDAQQAALYTVADTGAHLRHVADVYYRLNASTPAFYRHHASPGGTVPPPVLAQAGQPTIWGPPYKTPFNAIVCQQS